MSKPSHKVAGKYSFLLALEVGESYDFANKPSLVEARRHAAPSKRSAYLCVSRGVGALRTQFPSYSFKVELANTRGSRIPGDIVRVTLLGKDGVISNMDDFEASERKRLQALESWKKRKQAEDAPKLPGQLQEAEAEEQAKRVAKAKESQSLRVITNRYDPAKIAELVMAYARGEQIERLVDGRWLIDREPTWTHPTALYRVKPKVREWFVVVGHDGKIHAHAETVKALPHHDPQCRIKVREVQEEDEE